MTLFWVWLVVSSVITLIFAVIAVLSALEAEFDITVVSVRLGLLSWLWPLVIPYVIIAVAFNRNPCDLTARLY